MPTIDDQPLTYEELVSFVHYDPETGHFSWRMKKSPWLRQAGCINKTIGYRVIRLKGKLYYEHRLAWFYMTGHWPEEEIDHVSGDSLDNRFLNLRPATSSQQKMNRKTVAISGFKGVTSYGERFHAGLKYQGKNYSLGVFDTPEEANHAYGVFAKKMFGEYARWE